MRVDHGGLNILVPEQLLHGADVVPSPQQLGRERVPKRVWRHLLGDPGLEPRSPDRSLHRRLVEVVTSSLPGLWIPVRPCGREDPLPWPLPVGVRVLGSQRSREGNPAGSALEVSLVLLLHLDEMRAQLPSNASVRLFSSSSCSSLARPNDR